LFCVPLLFICNLFAVFSHVPSSQVIFSGLHVFSKPALAYVPPFVFAMFRLASAVPFIHWLAKKEGGLPHITQKDYPYLFLLGLFGVTLPQGLIFVGNKLAGPQIVAIMQPSIPVWVSGISAAMRLEKLSLGKALGIACAVAGSLILLGIDQLDFQGDQTIGTLIMVLQTLSYSIYLVMLQWKLKTLPYPVGVFFYAVCFGLALVILIAMTQIAQTQWDCPVYVWFAILYCGLVATTWAHSTNSWAVRHVSNGLCCTANNYYDAFFPPQRALTCTSFSTFEILYSHPQDSYWTCL
jgi:drug/metabolite transporter (DMT)-like permease